MNIAQMVHEYQLKNDLTDNKSTTSKLVISLTHRGRKLAFLAIVCDIFRVRKSSKIFYQNDQIKVKVNDF